MKAMCLNFQNAFVWSDVPDPAVHDEFDVILQTKACALNRADLMQRAGTYPPPPGWPSWPGLECAGIVLQAPTSSRFRPGDHVCALLGGGGYAERVAVPAGQCLPIPEGLSFEEAAAIPEVFATAYLNFRFEADLQPGETLFLQAAASGLGLASIQLAKHVFHAKVVATVGSEAKAYIVRRYGADVVANRRTDNLTDVLAANPPDVALDCVGGPGMGALFAQMAPHGRWISIATLAGAEAEINLGTVFRKGLRLIGSTLRSRTPERKEEILAALERDAWPLFASRTIAPILHKVLPISEVEEAHRILAANENMGKVVLTL